MDESGGKVQTCGQDGKIKTGTPQVREMGKEKGSHWLYTRKWEEGIRTGNIQESQETEGCT